MLKEASGFCEGVSRCTEGGIWMHSSSRSRNNEQNAGKFIKLNFKHTIQENLGRSSPNEVRNNVITNKRIETQRIKDLTQIKKSDFFTVACVYTYKYNLISSLS